MEGGACTQGHVQWSRQELLNASMIRCEHQGIDGVDVTACSVFTLGFTRSSSRPPQEPGGDWSALVDVVQLCLLTSAARAGSSGSSREAPRLPFWSAPPVSGSGRCCDCSVVREPCDEEVGWNPVEPGNTGVASGRAGL